MRRCTRCGVEKPADKRYFRYRVHHGIAGFEARCKPCEMARGRERYRLTHGLPTDAPLLRPGPSPFDADGMRTCAGCHQRLAATEYTTWVSSSTGRVVTRSYCKECTRQQQNALRRRRRAEKRGEAPRPARVWPVKILSRTCLGCKQTMPRAAFEHITPQGKVIVKKRCGPCRIVAQHIGRPRTRPAPKPVVPRVLRVAPERPQHPCSDCGLPMFGTTAGETVFGRARRCKDCRRAFTDAHAVESDVSNRIRAQKRVLKGDHKGLMWINPHEVWGLDYLCQGCKKPIYEPGKCYTCASGRPRTILRPEERRQAVAA